MVWNVTSTPAAFLASDANAYDSSTPVDAADSGWLAQTNLIGVPGGMPAPHSPAPLPALAQVVSPPGLTFQPCAFSVATALLGLYG